MEKERKNEIAYALLKGHMSEKGLPLNKEAVKEARRVASNLLVAGEKISYEELQEFLEIIVRELVEEMFAR